MAQIFNVASQKIRSRPKQLTFPEDIESHSDCFPKFHQLIVTTAKGIYVWTRDGFKEVFCSGTGGIVAAKKLSHSSNLVAVADSQIVVLHDINRGQQHSHKLKGTDGQVRSLKYQEDSMNLYFTTSLQHAVQRYSLLTAKVLEPSYAHPSPPTVIAVSVSSHLLLSASTSPPIIHLTSLLINERPILIKPSASSSAVVAAAFHPSEDTIFVLGFADGTVAAYDAKHMFYDGGLGGRKINVFDYGSTGEISRIRKLHVVGTATSCSDPDRASFFCGYDNGTKTAAAGDLAQSITAIAFVPGFACVAVSVGTDGKCCVVDFGLGTLAGAEVVHTWHIHGAATSISVLSMRPDFPWRKVDDLDGPSQTSNEVLTISPLVAVGRQDGTVLLFDLEGNLQEQRTFGSEDARIIDVEWLSNPDGEYKEARQERKNRHIVSVVNGQFTNPIKKGRPVYQILPRASVVTRSSKPSVPSTSHFSTGLRSAAPTSIQAESYRTRADTMSTAKTTTDHSDHPSQSVTHPGSQSRRPSLGTTALNGSLSKRNEGLSKGNESPPKIPPRPVPRKEGKLAQRRAEKAREAQEVPVRQVSEEGLQTSDQADGPTSPSEVQEHIINPKPKDYATPESGSKIGKPKILVGPRKASNSSRKLSSKRKTSGTRTTVTSPPKRRPISTQPSTKAPTEHSNDTVIDWIANYGAPQSKILRKPTAKGSVVNVTDPLPPPPPTSASTLQPSIASDDTVIDWHTLKPGPTRQLNLLKTIDHTPHDSTVIATSQIQTLQPFSPRIHRIGPPPPQQAPPPPAHTSINSSMGLSLSPSPKASMTTAPGPQPQHPTFHPQHCPCIQDNILLHADIAELHKSVGQEIKSLKEAVKKSLWKQRKWVEAQIGIGEEGMRALEEENRRLRGELGRLTKGKEREERVNRAVGGSG